MYRIAVFTQMRPIVTDQ